MFTTFLIRIHLNDNIIIPCRPKNFEDMLSTLKIEFPTTNKHHLKIYATESHPHYQELISRFEKEIDIMKYQWYIEDIHRIKEDGIILLDFKDETTFDKITNKKY